METTRRQFSTVELKLALTAAKNKVLVKSLHDARIDREHSLDGKHFEDTFRVLVSTFEGKHLTVDHFLALFDDLFSDLKVDLTRINRTSLQEMVWNTGQTIPQILAS